MGMIGIIAQLVMDVEVDQQAGCEAQGKAEDIDQGKSLLAQQATCGNFQVVGWHTGRNACF
jgi:hypothetical protein